MKADPSDDSNLLWHLSLPGGFVMNRYCVIIFYIIAALAISNPAKAATYQIDIGASVDGEPIGLNDTIWATSDVTFDIYYENSDTLRGYQTGFTIWSTDGMDWQWDTALFDLQYIPGTNPPEFDTLYSMVTLVGGSRQYPPLTVWQETFSIHPADTNGGPRDSILFGSQVNYGGLVPGPLERQALMHFRPRGFVPLEVKTICIDSAKVGGGGDFIFADVAGQTYVPTALWPEGGRCWPVKRPPNSLPQFSNCPVSPIEISHCDQGQFDFEAEDADRDPVSFEIVSHTGSGVAEVGETTGELTYTVADADVHNTVAITVRAYDAFDPDGNICGIDFAITNQVPSIESCIFPDPVIRKFATGTVIEAGDPDLCDAVEYIMVDGPGEVGLTDGNYTWQTEVGDTLGSPHAVTIGVTDGFDTVTCVIEIEVYAPPPIHVTQLAGAEGTIRDAILYGVDSIVIEVSGELLLQQPLPAIWWPTNIIGTGAPSGATSFILDGTALVSGNGFEIDCSNNRVEGLTIRNFPGNGIAVTDPAAVNNTFTNNLIYQNGLLGIDLGGDGVTPNAADNFMDYPELDSVIYQGEAQFTLYGRAQPGARVELYVAHWSRGFEADTSGHGEAVEFVDFIDVDLSGAFSYPVDGNVYLPFTKITATATDADGNTSEFSGNAEVTTGPLVVIAYSPVNIIITDPDGKRFGWDENDDLIDELDPDSGAYHEDPNDSLVIYDPKQGDYRVSVIAESDAVSGDRYSSIIRLDGSMELCVAANQLVPSAGDTADYSYDVTDGFHYDNADANRDEGINIGDVVYLVNHIFHDGPAADPVTAGDANCDLGVNIGDAVYLINHIFHDGPPPCQFGEK